MWLVKKYWLIFFLVSNPILIVSVKWIAARMLVPGYICKKICKMKLVCRQQCYFYGFYAGVWSGDRLIFKIFHQTGGNQKNIKNAGYELQICLLLLLGVYEPAFLTMGIFHGDFPVFKNWAGRKTGIDKPSGYWPLGVNPRFLVLFWRCRQGQNDADKTVKMATINIFLASSSSFRSVRSRGSHRTARPPSQVLRRSAGQGK